MKITNSCLASDYLLLFTLVVTASTNSHAQQVMQSEFDIISINTTPSQETQSNVIILSQIGDDNLATINFDTNELPSNNQIDLAQSGDINLLNLMVYGDNNIVNIFQQGAGNKISADDDSPFLLTTNAASLSVSQIGNHNIVLGENSALNGTIVISQTGQFNVATVRQVN